MKARKKARRKETKKQRIKERRIEKKRLKGSITFRVIGRVLES